MKSILLSLLIIIAVGFSSFWVTKAYFYDKKTSSGNRFMVGTLNLEVGGSSGANVEPFVISDIGTGVDSGSKIWKVKNTGTLSGQFFVGLDNLNNSENGCNDPEKEVDSTCNNPGVGEGELGKYIKIIFYLNNEKLIESYLTNQDIQKITQYWANSNIVLEPGQEVELKMEWVADPNYGNEIQSDSLTFDNSFSLKQLTK